jgi:hypothetical protein
MGRRKCRVILSLMVAGCIVLTGCKKEAEQIVSKPMDTLKGGAVAASPTPSPTARRTPRPSASASPAPTNIDEFVKGIEDDEFQAMPVWQQVGVVAALSAGVLAVIYWIIRCCRKPKEEVSDDVGAGLGKPSASEAAALKAAQDKKTADAAAAGAKA